MNRQSSGVPSLKNPKEQSLGVEMDSAAWASRIAVLFSFLLAIAIPGHAQTPRPWKIFLLFGQSNMHGGSTSDAEDRKTNPRVKVLAYDNCTQNNRKYNQWYTAAPALHSCGTGVGLGDWFGKVLADSLPQDTIALIPCAVSGVDISFFSKGVTSSRRKDFSIPPDNHWTGAYPWMLERLKLAQEKGQIAGILLHQGEADWTDTARTRWPGRVAKIVSDLKEDLKFPDVPVVIGELRQDASACCGAHNPYVATAAKTVPNGAVVSSKGLEAAGDAYHLTSPGNREFGKRYAAVMLQALPKASLDRAHTGPDRLWTLESGSSGSWLAFSTPQEWIQVGTPDGRWIVQGSGDRIAIPSRHGLLLIRTQNGNGHRSWLLPSIF